MVDQRFEFDCIVIGSGFGGSVMAHELAERGHRVLVLERGKAYPPGGFPRTPLGNSTNVWDPSEDLYGLFDLWSFKQFHAIVSSGLGGGSLIYANVMMRKPPHWFDNAWPVTPAELAPHYDAVEEMLDVTDYPYVEATLKTAAMRRAAAQADLPWAPAPLAVSFSGADKPLGLPIGNRKRNIHLAPRTSCIQCGQCDAGCNSGSKNSMDHTYLSSRALRRHATIEKLHEVRIVRPVNGGYQVRGYVHQPPDPEWDRRRPPPPREEFDFRARCVVLAAGSLGSTFLLLRNRANLPLLSRQLGTRFSGNGDYLGLLRTRPERVLESSRGPVITGYFPHGINPGDPTDGQRGHVVQDGGYPVLGDWLYELIRPNTIKRLAKLGAAQLRAQWTGTSRARVSALVADAIGDSTHSRGLVPLLGMGQDVANGTMTLRNGELAVTWDEASTRETFEAIEATMSRVAEGLDAKFLKVRSSGLSRRITVHPLGGVPMATSIADGVVDPYGEVFGYPGLFVADGSVVPGPVGVNPALTIAALAHRFSDRVDARLTGES